MCCFFFSSRRRHTRCGRDWSSDVCSSDLALLDGARRVAMQYSPHNDVPYVARVDAGTIELVRTCNVEVLSSADLVQRFEAVWSPLQYASHTRAAAAVREVVDAAFAEIGRCARGARACGEGGV